MFKLIPGILERSHNVHWSFFMSLEEMLQTLKEICVLRCKAESSLCLLRQATKELIFLDIWILYILFLTTVNACVLWVFIKATWYVCLFPIMQRHLKLSSLTGKGWEVKESTEIRKVQNDLPPASGRNIVKCFLVQGLALSLASGTNKIWLASGL